MSSVAAGIFKMGRSMGDGEVTAAFSFVPNGSTAGTVLSIKGKGIASIVYAASNMWTVTFNSKFKSVLSCVCGVSDVAAGVAQGFTINMDVTATDVTTGVLQLRSVNGSGSAATIASTGSPRINVICVLSTSSLNS